MNAGDRIDAARGLLAEAMRELSEALRHERGRRRGALTRDLWQVRRMTGGAEGCFSRFGQDWFVDSLLHGKTGGVFVDVGGYDGVRGSNTLFFELMRGWTGLLIEPVQQSFEAARARRRCACLNCAIADRPGMADFLQVDRGYAQMSGLLSSYAADVLKTVRTNPEHRETLTRVETRTLAAVLEENGLQRIDYLSLDVEGGELPILTTFPFDRFDIAVWSIENNRQTKAIRDVMTAAGYRLAELLGVDEIYVRDAQ